MSGAACQSGNGSVSAKPRLVDIPISYNGAKCRFLIYKEGLEDQIDTVSPGVFGGMKSPEYLALNPQGKVPALILPSQGDSKPQCIAESEVVLLYLIEKYAPNSGLLPSTPEARAVARQAVRVVDVYMTPIQAATYRKMGLEARAEQIQELARQLDVLETYITGPYVLGDHMCSADISVLPTLVWMNYIMPRIFGWKSVFNNRPKLQGMYEAMAKEPAGQKVIQELEEGLEAWNQKGRWEETGINEHVANTSVNWDCS